MDSRTHKIAFGLLKGIVGDKAREMLRRVGSISDFFTMPRRQLALLTGVDIEIYDEQYRQNILQQAEKEATFTEVNNINVLSIAHNDYPRRVKDCEDAPATLYKLGNANLESAHIVGIVGTRHATPYGIDFTTRLVTDLAERLDNLVIVSGLAYGIDVASHKAAIACNVPTVGVLAHGLNTIYPADHRSVAAKMIEKGGALVSEYPTSSRIHRSNFLARNRIVAALCDCIVVVESDFRGGAMSTAHIASAYNRDVFAVPGRINDTYSRGTNELIYKNVATMLRNANDIILQMGWTPTKQQEKEEPKLFELLTAEQQRLFDFITNNPEATINDICVRLSMSYATTSNLIFELEMKDAIIAMPGGRFAPATKS